MERKYRPGVATFYAPGVWDHVVPLSEGAAHHAFVKRLSEGATVRLSGGDGRRTTGSIAKMDKRSLLIDVDASTLEIVPPFPYLELWAPIGDRDRTLVLAEKTTELGLSAWQPVSFARSRSVTSRSEGASFRGKLHARQISALEQSGSAWLPELRDDLTLSAALANDEPRTAGTKLLLDADGESFPEIAAKLESPVRIALGPEGGLEEEERDAFIRAGWRLVSLGDNVLRFETAGIAAVALVRSHLR